ncbi:GNAT family N-acetyltransferase [Streptomyces sp. NPDC008125]|uniref:GNAT family N-acetyltransferase n=1 Tax=Streptomyces sp. NPDC008125 TaxID=3364811 RepID=UPI0036EFCA65
MDDPELGVVSNAVGVREHRVPGPGNLSGLRGHVFRVSTEPAARKRGHARACTEELQRRFGEEAGVTMVDLDATPDGAHLYQALGSEVTGCPAPRIRLGSS